MDKVDELEIVWKELQDLDLLDEDNSKELDPDVRSYPMIFLVFYVTLFTSRYLYTHKNSMGSIEGRTSAYNKPVASQ